MFTSLRNTRRGFSLIELLVVISIIGILSSVVLAALATARQKSRDAKRIADLGQLRVGLELYFDRRDTYPTTTAATPSKPGGADGGIVIVAAEKFLPQVPVIPSRVRTEVTYIYRGLTSAGADCNAGAFCPRYLLGTNLERSDNVVLLTDPDDVIAAGNVFYGASNDCLVNTASVPDQCYALKS